MITVTAGKVSVTGRNFTSISPDFLSELRKSAGLSHRAVASLVGYKSSTGYSGYEYGEATPSIDTFTKIVKAIVPGKELKIKVGL
jgi:transcriptional regulator with XRE-family HTH domain